MLIFALSLGVTGCGEKEPVVATVNGEEIGLSEAVFYTRLNQQQWELAYVEALGRDFWKQSLGEENGTFADELKNQVMETICQIHLTNARAKEYEVELTKEEKAQVKTRAQEFFAGHSEAVKAAAGAEEKLVETLLTQRMLADKISEAMVADYVPQISQEEAALGQMTYCLFSTLGTYDAEGHHTPVTQEEVQQIAAEAQAFADRAQEMGDLIAAAKEAEHTSIDVFFNEQTNGGAHEDMAEVLRTLEVGQIAGPVKTEDGYYVFQYVSEYNEEASRANLEKLETQAVEDRYWELYGQWREQADIVIHWDVWNTVVVDAVLFAE